MANYEHIQTVQTNMGMRNMMMRGMMMPNASALRSQQI